MPSDTVTCPECDEGFETEEELREHFFDSHLLTRSEVAHTDHHDERSAETTTENRKLGYGLVGTVVLTGLLGGLVAISGYNDVPPRLSDEGWVILTVYGAVVVVIILLFITILTNPDALHDET